MSGGGSVFPQQNPMAIFTTTDFRKFQSDVPFGCGGDVGPSDLGSMTPGRGPDAGLQAMMNNQRSAAMQT